MIKTAVSKTVLRENYRPFAWILDQLKLRFEIGDESTRVISELQLSRNPSARPSNEIELDGQQMELVSVLMDGNVLAPGDYSLNTDKLVIQNAPDSCALTIEVLIKPQENTALEGLYSSGGFLLTQCEAEGFRKITYFPDRPDVMTRFDVTIVADVKRYPVLLSNGNPVGSGELDDGRHWVHWNDPFAKPSYLFALVAGDLAHIEDHFVTRSGRVVTLRIYVEHENVGRCDHAMESLRNAMKWDEDRFGLEYDLDIYNIVATNDFNMGAMENKSLNIFNSKFVLAQPDTATDVDYQGIEGVIGHEYFHNWTGNRVTCQDWFQLTLKEGLTVFRDQEFSSDMQSRAVNRIQDVRDLRSRQFPEDSGPMSHPIRPNKYIEINNFYTMTVYQKGASIIRMYHTLLGEEGFQKGMKLYFERHDGQAVTCDDFLAAMADANGVDLQRFGAWYSQSGTPEVSVTTEYDAERSRFTLNLSQRTLPTIDQQEKQALVIPFKMGLLSPQGEEYPLQLSGEDSPSGTSRLLMLEEDEQSFTFVNIPQAPVPSLLRDFSAPVKLRHTWSANDLAVLMAHDSDSFMRWEAAQLLAQGEILSNVERCANGVSMEVDRGLIDAFRMLLENSGFDPALVAEAITLPGEDYLAEQMELVDVDGIHAARTFVKTTLATELKSLFQEKYVLLDNGAVYDKSPASIARRSLKNTCLSYLLQTRGGVALAEAQLAASDNMTDTLAALHGLVWAGTSSAAAALSAFEQRWIDDALVMDKWFAIQASKPGEATIEVVRTLMEHPAFSITNPNKVRSLIGAFSMANPTGFHAANGAAYRFHADRVIELDSLNPQVASRMASAFNQWRRYDQDRQALMKIELERIAAVDDLSPGVFEIVSKAIGA
ncbi:MAG: aminopeptidase N [Proteobacteria bacterium]|nr:aminopeptidase N [Pseudomonadota bacterium]